MKKKSVIKINFSNTMAEQVGNVNGITNAEWKKLEKTTQKAFSKCKNEFEAGNIGFMKLPLENNSLELITDLAKKHRNRWNNIVVFGIGGSALGITMLFKALSHPYHNQLDPDLRNNAPRLFVMDNIDPEGVSSLKPLINPDNTMINIITKSGGTTETWGTYFQYLSVFNFTPKADQVVAITDPAKGFLNKYARSQGWDTLAIPEDVGGRFSVLTPVGLFSAAMLNIDISQIIDGARFMHEQCMNPDFDENPALKLAAVKSYMLKNKGKQISVLMPYANSLASFADWYRQLWAESLGKKTDLNGKIIHTGQTPVKALGATDQHSQIQLYQAGPNDKLITFLSVNSMRFGGPMNNAPADTPHENLRFLDAGEVLNLEMQGTRDALTESNRPNLTIQLPAVTPFYMGQLIYLYELTTYLTGILLNINPFDQPGVEAGKLIARKMIQEIYQKRTETQS